MNAVADEKGDDHLTRRCELLDEIEREHDEYRLDLSYRRFRKDVVGETLISAGRLTLYDGFILQKSPLRAHLLCADLRGDGVLVDTDRL